MLDKSLIEWVQSRLASHGFPTGMIDGVYGPVTENAVKALQKARGIVPTGTLGAKTIDALRATSSKIEGPAQLTLIKDAILPARTPFPRQKDVARVYGDPGSGLIQIELPYDMYLAWEPLQRVRKMTLHKMVAESARRVLTKVADTYSLKERDALGLDKFGGSFNIRKMRGGQAMSMHSWGIAIDFDPARNALKAHRPEARLSHEDAVPFWEAWEAEGWLSLGRAKNFDWMHVQAAML